MPKLQKLNVRNFLQVCVNVQTDIVTSMAGDSFTCTFEEFKQRSKELIDAAPTLDEDQKENGFKALGISYFNMEGTDGEVYQASIVLKIVARQLGL